jgi:hypothetical protein
MSVGCLGDENVLEQRIQNVRLCAFLTENRGRFVVEFLKVSIKFLLFLVLLRVDGVVKAPCDSSCEIV